MTVELCLPCPGGPEPEERSSRLRWEAPGKPEEAESGQIRISHLRRRFLISLWKVPEDESTQGAQGWRVFAWRQRKGFQQE